MNQVQLMQQMRKMQQEMVKAQEELANTTVVGAAASNAVTVEMTADNRVKRVTVAKDALDPDDVETLEDLILVAVNDALQKARAVSEARMSSVTGGLRIPGLS